MKKRYFYIGAGCLVIVAWLAVVGFNNFHKPSLRNSVERQQQLLTLLTEKIEPVFMTSNIKILPQFQIVDNAIELALVMPDEQEVELNTKITNSKLELSGTATTDVEEVIEKDNGRGGVMKMTSKRRSSRTFNVNLDLGVPIDGDAMVMEQDGNHYKIILPLK